MFRILKKTKNILSILNLLLFLVSFSFYSINSIAGLSASLSQDQIHKKYTEKQNSTDNNSSQQLSEKNETETESEKDFTAPAFVLNFFVSCFQLEVLQTSPHSAQLLAENTSNPIYISVRNFRI